MTGRLRCRLGRHDWEYFVTDEMVVRWCRRCKSPRAANVYPAKRLDAPASSTTAVDPATDRPLINLDPDSLRTAAGMLKTLKTDDLEGFNILARHSDPGLLLLALCCLTSDALQEHASDDLGAYTDRLFTRLDRSQQ